MALTYDQISAITEKKFIPKLYDNIFDSNPLIMRLKQKSYERIDGGERVLMPLNYAKTTAAGFYSGADTLSTVDNDGITAAEYTWKQLYANITISGLDERKNSGDAAILSLVKNKVKIAEKTVLDQLSTGVYSDGTDPKSIVGLRTIVATTSTVGGISQSTNSWWAAKVDSSTTTLTMAAVQSLWTQATVNNDSPTFIVSTRSNYDRYYALLQPQQRFQDSKMAEGGFASLMFNGAAWAADSYCPTSHILLLNENYLHLVAHKDEDMRFEPFQKPINQNLKVAKIYWMGVFGSSNCRLQAKLSAIAA